MGTPDQERVPENLRKQLAVAVRSIQWSYAIFWSLSSTQQGVLEWSDGYYNGDIRTRKTVQSGEVNADKLGLQRSQQLRELYESLLEGESELASKRPCAALSPEDLTDLEWYYLVCMSFVFKFGQGLPGRALASSESIWLCNAHDADSKSASIQTVICFPHIGGVVELGINDLVVEDLNLIQHIKTSLLEFAKPVCSAESSSDDHTTDYDEGPISAKVSDMNHEILDTTAAFATLYPPTEEIQFDHEMVNELHISISEEFSMDSPDDCSNDCCGNNHQTEASFVLEENDDLASPFQSWHLMEDDLSHCIQDSINSTGCISQVFASQETTVENVTNLHLKELQDCNDTKFSSLGLGADGDDLPYKRTISILLQSSPQLGKDNSLHVWDGRSSFTCWKKEGSIDYFRPQSPQRTLKKLLFMVPENPPKTLNEDERKDGPLRPKVDDICVLHGLSEKRRENDKYLVLKSMVPSISKIDNTSILNDTIEYLKELEARVEELETCVNVAESEERTRRRYLDVMERTSDNYENKRSENGKKPWMNKRKACDIDETDPQLWKVNPIDNLPLDIKISIRENEVLIKMRCPWREYLLLDILEAMNKLNLDARTVQSSTLDGMLTLSLKSKFRGAAFASAGMIKQALRRTVGIC
ncbi:hypothetical protein Ancab_037863 [Ancistrocladus abbreviatus]